MSNPNQVVVSQVTDTTTVEITTVGPQGPAFSASNKALEDSNAVDGSVIVFKAANNRFEATATDTVLTLVDGGNF
tara:strand:- start:468 stop:692 length:225 start_codon:yes stop_codon:yes gene_type:complete